VGWGGQSCSGGSAEADGAGGGAWHVPSFTHERSGLRKAAWRRQDPGPRIHRAPACLRVSRLEVPKVFFSPPSAKTAPVRALLFDISFLMLCHVAQTYGSEVSILRGDGAPARVLQPATVPTVPAATPSRGGKHPVPSTWCRQKSVAAGSASARQRSEGGCSLPEGFGCAPFTVPWCRWERCLRTLSGLALISPDFSQYCPSCLALVDWGGPCSHAERQPSSPKTGGTCCPAQETALLVA